MHRQGLDGPPTSGCCRRPPRSIPPLPQDECRRTQTRKKTTSNLVETHPKRSKARSSPIGQDPLLCSDPSRPTPVSFPLFFEITVVEIHSHGTIGVSSERLLSTFADAAPVVLADAPPTSPFQQRPDRTSAATTISHLSQSSVGRSGLHPMITSVQHQNLVRHLSSADDLHDFKPGFLSPTITTAASSR